MSQDLHEFENALLASRDAYVDQHNRHVEKAQSQFGRRHVAEKKIDLPTTPPKPKSMGPSVSKVGYVVKLAVRTKRLALDDMFEYTSRKLSELEAKIDAEKAARDAGYPIIGYVYSIEKLT